MLLILCKYKSVVKIGRPVNSLALVPKSKSYWIATPVKAKYAHHDEYEKSNVVPSVILVTDVLNDCNLGNFYK